MRDIYLDVKELSDKIIRGLPKENAYFVKLTFQELHVCLVLRALESLNAVHTTIGPGGGKTFVQH